MSNTNSSSNKNMFDRKSDDALDALVDHVQQVESAFMKEEAGTLDKAGLNTTSTYWAVEGTLGARGVNRMSSTMSTMTVTFDDGESMLVRLPEKSFNRFFKLLQSRRGKRIAILNFQYHQSDHSIMFRDVGTMVLVEDEAGEMVIPACNYGPHSMYSEPTSAMSRFTGSKRLASDMDDAAPAPTSSVASLPTVLDASFPAAAPSPAAILGGSAGSLDFANLNRAELLALCAKLVAPLAKL